MDGRQISLYSAYCILMKTSAIVLRGMNPDEPHLLLPQSLLDYSIPFKLNVDGAEYNSHHGKIIIIREGSNIYFIIIQH